MTDPRHHTDTNGGRHTTHVPFSLSDSELSEDWDPEEIYEGWGFDPAEGDDDDA